MNPFDSRPGIFDIAWRMFGIQVRIKPSYWIFLALFGYFMGGVKDWQSILAWVLSAFVTTMFEKLFQVIVGRFFGYPGAIILVAMGGGVVAEYARAHRWQRIVINAASIVGIVVLLVILIQVTPFVIARLAFLGKWEEFVRHLVYFLPFFSFFSLVANMLPILPNAAGQIVTDLLGYAVGSRDFIWGTVVSILVAGGVVAYSVYKAYHVEAPYLRELSNMIFPLTVPNLFRQIDPSPIFIAFLFGLSLIFNVANLFFKKR